MSDTKPCARCGKEITGSKHGKVLYCADCRKEVTREQKQASRARLKADICAIRYKPVKLVCNCCGEEFYGFPLSKYCALCRPKVRRDQARIASQRRRKEKTILQLTSAIATGKTLEDWIREARLCGLDYGSYRTLVEKVGLTFEEIKAQNHRPCCHSHCKAFRKMA